MEAGSESSGKERGTQEDEWQRAGGREEGPASDGPGWWVQHTAGGRDTCKGEAWRWLEGERWGVEPQRAQPWPQPCRLTNITLGHGFLLSVASRNITNPTQLRVDSTRVCMMQSHCASGSLSRNQP